MKVTRSLETVTDFERTFSVMEELFGEQSHVSAELLSNVALSFPELFVEIYDLEKEKQIGHCLIFPFNEWGKAKITDHRVKEEDMEISDFARPSLRTPIHFFIYSLYGESIRHSVEMISSGYFGIAACSNEVAHSSSVFAECVSEEGIKVSEKMGLDFDYNYIFEGELIHIYQSSISNFLEKGQRHRAVMKNSLTAHSLH